MAFEFDTDLEMGKTDIPRIVYMSKEDDVLAVMRASVVNGLATVASRTVHCIKQLIGLLPSLDGGESIQTK